MVRTRDSTPYYGCDDHFVLVDKAVDCGRKGPESDETSLELKDEGRLSDGSATSQSLDNLTIESRITMEDDSERGIFQHLVRALVAFVVAVLSSFHILGRREVRQLGNNRPSDTLDPTANHHPTMETIEEHLNPCLERLQRLEMMFDELSSKPAEIPLEKERLLLEYWDRIKLIEFDLEKTKKVLRATLTKQQEIGESLKAVQELNLARWKC